MSHTIKAKSKLLNRIHRIVGQMAALQRAVESERECGEVLRLIAAARGALDSLMAEVLEGHLREHATTTHQTPTAALAAADDLIEIVRTYLR